MEPKEQRDDATSAFTRLADHKYCQLVTFRRDGTAVETPVWFAVEAGRVYVKTEDPSGKVKRIRREARVQVAPCTVTGKHLGPATDAVARILSSEHETERAETVLRRRYAFGRWLFSVLVEPLFRLRGQQPVYLEVTVSR